MSYSSTYSHVSFFINRLSRTCTICHSASKLTLPKNQGCRLSISSFEGPPALPDAMGPLDSRQGRSHGSPFLSLPLPTSQPRSCGSSLRCESDLATSQNDRNDFQPDPRPQTKAPLWHGRRVEDEPFFMRPTGNMEIRSDKHR